MILKQITIKNFRNYLQKYQLVPSPTTTVIIGPNGAGKTNLLEAIYLLATVKSPRVKYDSQLINWQSDNAWIEGNIKGQGDETNLSLGIIKKDPVGHLATKRYLINQVSKTQQAFLQKFKAVLFTPEDIKLVLGSPQRRRDYLDTMLSQFSNEYYQNIKQYQQAVRQKNHLLRLIKNQVQTTATLPFWNGKIIELGVTINKFREEFFSFCKDNLPILSKDIFHNNNLCLEYNPKELNLSRLRHYQEAEIASGRCLVGPHKDDFTFLLDERDLSFFGSRGQQRLATLALKILEYRYLSKNGDSPTLLLDDIFSELDPSYQVLVVNLFKKGQTIITTTHPEIIPSSNQDWKIINLTE